MPRFVFQGGMPRSGSTVLSAILDQNPRLHAAQHSPVCQVMWDLQMSLAVNCAEQLHASNRGDFQDEIIAHIPNRYWKHATAPVIVDKCMTWPLPDNVAIVRRYITESPKFVVLDRCDDDVVESFRGVYDRAGLDFDEEQFRLQGSAPVMRSREAVEAARAIDDADTFHFVDFDDFMSDAPAVIAGIYDFWGLEPYKHDFRRIISAHPENESVYGVPGLHTIRPVVGHRLPA